MEIRVPINIPASVVMDKAGFWIHTETTSALGNGCFLGLHCLLEKLGHRQTAVASHIYVLHFFITLKSPSSLGKRTLWWILG